MNNTIEKRYNIALIPQRNFEAYVEIANAHFRKNAEGYLLGPYSIPHITMCQFITTSSTLPHIHRELEKAHKNPPIHLTGLRFSNKHASSLWGVSLSVQRSPELLRLLDHVVNILYQHTLKPLNHVGELYTPHLTLARVNTIQLNHFSKDIFKEDIFRLALGESDDLGQLTKIIHQF